MDTQTKLMATPAQAKKLIAALQKAIEEADKKGEAAYARVVLMQMANEGPWGLTVGVFPSDGPNAR